jgi:hypothetical protein
LKDVTVGSDSCGVLKTLQLRDAVFGRLEFLGLGDGWASQIHFGSGGYESWSSSSPAAVLKAWQSPINTIAMTLPSTNGGGDGGSDISYGHMRSDGQGAGASRLKLAAELLYSAARLDGHYGWCLWPGEVEYGTVVDGGDGCDPTLGGLDCSSQPDGSCDYVLVRLPKAVFHLNNF